jgi:hypothetical protein
MTLEEMHQDADIARLLLFARHPNHDGSDSKKDPKPKRNRNKTQQTSSINATSLVLNESSLLGESPEAVLSAIRQSKKGALVLRMLQAMDRCIQQLSKQEKTGSIHGECKHEDKKQTVLESTGGGSSSRQNQHRMVLYPEQKPFPSKDDHRDTLPLKLFSLASFRMQMVMMRAMGPKIQQECLREIVTSILDFPAMSLSHIQRQTAEDATLACLFDVAYANLMEQVKTIQRTTSTNTIDDEAATSTLVLEESMLTVLALGISSGQIHYLLHALDVLLQHPDAYQAISPQCASAYETLQERVEAYATQSPLSATEEGTLLHYIRVKPAMPASTHPTHHNNHHQNTIAFGVENHDSNNNNNNNNNLGVRRDEHFESFESRDTTEYNDSVDEGRWTKQHNP